MDLPNTLLLLARNPELVAWRDRGIAIRVTEAQVIQRILVRKPYRWMPFFGDLVATDWQTGTFDQLQKHARAAADEVAA